MITGITHQATRQGTRHVVFTHASSPSVSVYPWDGSSLGTKLSNASTALPLGGQESEFSENFDYVFIGTDTTPFINAYAWNNGFGTKVSNPATLPAGGGWSIDYNPKTKHVAVASQTTSPYENVYPWTGSAFGTKVSAPASTLTGAGSGVRFSNARDYISYGQSASPYILTYPWSSSGYGTKVADPTTLPGITSGRVIRFSPSDDVIVVVGAGGSGTYPWTGSYGTRYTAPTLNGGGYSVDFTTEGDWVLFGAGSAPRIYAYPWSFSSGYGTKATDPATVPAGAGRGADFSYDSAHAGIGGGSSPYIAVYPWTGSFGTKLSDPATLPTGQGEGVKFKWWGKY